MTLEPPQPPTAPAPAVRPTPPTPPRIDRTPFAKDSEQAADDSPETQARDAVANGSGALTKRTVERPDDDKSPPANQTVTVIPPDVPLVSDTQSDYDRGKDVLREFRDLDAREAQNSDNLPAQTSTEQPRQVIPKLNYHEGHSGAYWILTIVIVAVAAFVVAKNFLFTDKPQLTKSQLFEDSTNRLKAAADKVKPVKPPPAKPARLPDKRDDDKGKHFEVRV
ncbi:MAG: hypothetical protein IKI76_07365 [Selenomonadaceae bacterium]|nr:hypothetical protein [Selenomonadaceae bacterium]